MNRENGRKPSDDRFSEDHGHREYLKLDRRPMSWRWRFFWVLLISAWAVVTVVYFTQCRARGAL